VDYKDFYNVFLAEMPWQISGSNDFAAQLEMLKELVVYSNIETTGKLCKVENGDQVTYWIGDKELQNVQMIVDTEMSGNFCKIVLTGKNPSIPKGTPPFASDMYAEIKNDVKNKNLSFSSDSMMTDDAIRLWNRLLTQGNVISVFNTIANKYELIDVKTSDELAQYVGDNTKQKYIFVLSESKQNYVGVKHGVGLMELKRNAGYPLQEMFEQMKRNKK
jgi:hypothetical protein